MIYHAIDRGRYFAYHRDFFNGLSTPQLDALGRVEGEGLLGSIESDPHLTHPRWAPYILATAKRETASTYLPIREYGSYSYVINRYGFGNAKSTRKAKELGNDSDAEAWAYRGAGLVQLTGENNFTVMEEVVREFYPDLVARFEAEKGIPFDITVGDQPGDIRDADNAMVPYIAYAIMSAGMRQGRFTGKDLDDFINEDYTDYYRARRIVNGMDHAREIANDALKFERALQAAGYSWKV